MFNFWRISTWQGKQMDNVNKRKDFSSYKIRVFMNIPVIQLKKHKLLWCNTSKSAIWGSYQNIQKVQTKIFLSKLSALVVCLQASALRPALTFILRLHKNSIKMKRALLEHIEGLPPVFMVHSLTWLSLLLYTVIINSHPQVHIYRLATINNRSVLIYYVALLSFLGTIIENIHQDLKLGFEIM